MKHSADPDNPTCWLEVALVPQAIDGTLEDRANPGRFATLGPPDAGWSRTLSRPFGMRIDAERVD